MNQNEFFNNAKWVGAKERTPDTFSVLKGTFLVESIKKASLNILGLGFFKCYINGTLINPDTFLPLSSDFENTCDPEGEVLSAHRIYVPQFDITEFVKLGENEIEIRFGGGWYTFRNRVFGLPKAIYCITVQDENDNISYFESNEACKISSGFVEGYHFVMSEEQNLNKLDFDNVIFENAVICEDLTTEYCTTNCPIDALVAEIKPKKIGKGSFGGIVYDCGENTTGYPVLKINAKKGEVVTVYFSEEILENGNIDMEHDQGQYFKVVSDGKGQIIQPEFTWYGFRCFEVVGDAEPTTVKVVRANVPVTSTFQSSNETLNWIYKTFIHTMLCNMHTGHPSDCPHLERRGYTGDGQLTCHAVLTIFGAKEFYEKWLQDIADGQDTLSGHIQYTAPYIRSGGGPGGWGSAIVEVPYQMYRHYGDKEYLSKYYNNMRRYIDYLEAHSDFGLVTSDKKGEWCLGDWCGPNILYPEKEIISHNQQVFLPAPFVNTYFMIKSLTQMCEIAHIIGKDSDIKEYQEKIELRKKAVTGAYFNTFDDNFIMNIQGANVFGIDIGLGNENTFKFMVDYYKKLGFYDTGIFATDILTRLLFTKGEEDLAVSLMTSDGFQGFEHWRKTGATTFHEYWDSNRSRSHNHPMFGAVAAYLFEYLLGIKQRAGTAGYCDLVIEPKAVARFENMSGSITTPNGVVSVGYKKASDKVKFNINIPNNVKAEFILFGKTYPLLVGKNELEISI